MEFKILLTVIHIKEITIMGSQEAMDNIVGQMDLIIKDNFSKDLDKEKEFGLVNMVINILGILVEIEKMDKVNIYGQTVIITKVNFAKI